MQLAPVKQGKNGIQKDKSSERPDSGVAPEDATHFSDALDIPVMGHVELANDSYMDIPDPSFTSGSR